MSVYTATVRTGENAALSKVRKCIFSINDPRQIPACEKLIENFRRLYGEESTHLLNYNLNFIANHIKK